MEEEYFRNNLIVIKPSVHNSASAATMLVEEY
jgi:hypothetical protein